MQIFYLLFTKAECYAHSIFSLHVQLQDKIQKSGSFAKNYSIKAMRVNTTYKPSAKEGHNYKKREVHTTLMYLQKDKRKISHKLRQQQKQL